MSKTKSYTEPEKNLLMTLVQDHKKVVETKRVDGNSLHLKHIAWEDIAKNYNAQKRIIHCQRTPGQLRKLWSNLKQRKKKSLEMLEKRSPLADSALSDDTMFEEAINSGSSQEYLLDNKAFDKYALEDHIEIVHADVESSFNDYPFSKNSETIVNNLSNKRKDWDEYERKLMAKKLKDSIEQQAELHNITMSIEKKRLEILNAALNKTRAEEELASLELQMFKDQNNLL